MREGCRFIQPQHCPGWKGPQKIIWSDLPWQREPRWDYLTSCPTPSWKHAVIGPPPCPLGGCYSDYCCHCKKKNISFVEVKPLLVPFLFAFSMWLPGGQNSHPLCSHPLSTGIWWWGPPEPPLLQGKRLVSNRKSRKIKTSACWYPVGQKKDGSRRPGCSTDERAETRGGCSSPTKTLGIHLQRGPGVYFKQDSSLVRSIKIIWGNCANYKSKNYHIFACL